jgi:hypothetical protein
MASFGEVLAGFKNSEEAENVVAILNNEDLQNCLIAWKSVRVRYKSASDCSEVDPNAKWEWMWTQINYDMETYGMVAGIKMQDVGRAVERLKGLRLIYPDGTINTMAKQYLQSIIMTKIKSLLPKKGKKDEKDEDFEKNENSEKK